MSESGRGTSGNWWKTPLLDLLEKVRQREDQVFLVLTLVIGALTGLAVVAFILLTERLGMRLYPPGAAPWRRLLFPVVGSLGSDICCFAIFPTREAAEYHSPKLRCMHAKAASCWSVWARRSLASCRPP